MVFSILNRTFLSILVFFAVSFLSILFQMPPFQYQKFPAYIGFPFSYYNQFWPGGSCIPNSGWNIDYLMYDCMLTWILVTGAYVMIKRKKFKSNH